MNSDGLLRRFSAVSVSVLLQRHRWDKCTELYFEILESKWLSRSDKKISAHSHFLFADRNPTFLH